jgi:hypothetical protein
VAKKSRTPPPPRRVQSPKTRSSAGGGTGVDRRLAILIAVAALGFAGLGIAIGLIVMGGSDSDSARAALEEAGCTLQTFPAQQANHVDRLPDGFEYNSDPATSGPHFPEWATWDVYDDPVEEIRLVHNLEHGGVVIQYGDDVPQAQVDALIDWYRGAPEGIVIAPRPDLGNVIALSAWNADPGADDGEGILAKCQRFDQAAFDAYMDAYAFKGRERFDKEQLAPGT